MLVVLSGNGSIIVNGVIAYREAIGRAFMYTGAMPMKFPTAVANSFLRGPV